MTKTIFEEMGGTYVRQGDYFIPCLTLPAEKETVIGVWGQQHLRYLKKYRRITYSTYLQAIGLIPILQTLIGKHRNALNYLQSR